MNRRETVARRAGNAPRFGGASFSCRTLAPVVLRSGPHRGRGGNRGP